MLPLAPMPRPSEGLLAGPVPVQRYSEYVTRPVEERLALGSDAVVGRWTPLTASAQITPKARHTPGPPLHPAVAAGGAQGPAACPGSCALLRPHKQGLRLWRHDRGTAEGPHHALRHDRRPPRHHPHIRRAVHRRPGPVPQGGVRKPKGNWRLPSAGTLIPMGIPQAAPGMLQLCILAVESIVFNMEPAFFTGLLRALRLHCEEKRQPWGRRKRRSALLQQTLVVVVEFPSDPHEQQPHHRRRSLLSLLQRNHGRPPPQLSMKPTTSAHHHHCPLPKQLLHPRQPMNLR